MTPRIPSRLSRLPSLRKRRGKSEPSRAERSAPPTCPPADAEARSARGGAAVWAQARWPLALRDAQDETAFYVARWNEADGEKDIPPDLMVRAAPAGNSRLGRIIGPCSTCPISSRSRARP